MSELLDALPRAFFANSGDTVSLRQLLEWSYGELGQKIEGVRIGWENASDPKIPDDFSYWNPAQPAWTRVLDTKGAPILSQWTNSIFVSAADFGNVTILAGNNIFPNLTIEWLIGTRTIQAGAGTDQVYQALRLATVPFWAAGSHDGIVEPDDIVAMARNFAKQYNGTANQNDCHNMAAVIAAAAGATFSTQDTESRNPAENQEGGFWRIVHRGSDNPVAGWQYLVRPGDIVRFGWRANDLEHTFVVTGPSSEELEKDPDIPTFETRWVWNEDAKDWLPHKNFGKIKVVDNSGNTIGERWHKFDEWLSDPKTVTIYRLDYGQRYLTNGSDLSDTLLGTKWADEINGGDGHDTIYGGEDDDAIDGGWGNDVLEGGPGSDDLRGGGDIDTVSYANSREGAVADLDNYSRNGGSALGDRFMGDIENLTGSNYAGDMLFGDEKENLLSGMGGGDALNGRGGYDTLRGGADDDHYYLIDASLHDFGNGIAANSFDAVEEMEGAGFDSVYVSSEVLVAWFPGLYLYSYALPANVEAGWVDGDRPFRLTGNGLGNWLYGNEARNVLTGEGGDDQLYGYGAGDDSTGGAGADRMDGGEGEDVFYVDNGTALGGDIVDGGDGQDEVWADDSVAGSGLYLNLYPTGTPITTELNIPHSAAMDVEVVHGSSGNDIIDASRLVDESVGVKGFAGNDIFISGAFWDIFDGGEETDGSEDSDIIGYTGMPSSYLITATDTEGVFFIQDRTSGAFDVVKDVEIAMFADGSSIDLTAFQPTPAAPPEAPPPEPPAPPAGQSFDGTGFWGGTVAGGAGVDSVSYASARHAVYVDLAREGGFAEAQTGTRENAHLWSIENVTGAASYMNWLHGDHNDNAITGGDSYDWLTGRGGSNRLDGRDGLDTADYLETMAPVTIDLRTGTAYHSTGVDTVVNIEQFRGTNSADTFTGDAQDNYFNAMSGEDGARGGAGNDWLEGFGGRDTLEGEAGADKLVGGLDDDTLIGGTDADTYVFRTADGGHDRILDFNRAEGDVIDFREQAAVNNLADLSIVGDGNGNTLVRYGGDSIFLAGVAPSSVQQDWFMF